MRLLQVLLWLPVGVVLLATWGCHERPRVTAVRGGPEIVYAEEPAYVIVERTPPALIVEHRPPMPGPRHIWVDGCWGWDRRRYVWTRGRWVVPPREHVVWVSPHHEKFGHGYRYTRGHWHEEGPQMGHEHR